jgi:hypothetical protein
MASVSTTAANDARRASEQGLPVLVYQFGRSHEDAGDQIEAIEAQGWRLEHIWYYPERCQNGHEWGPGLITVAWVMCDCGPAEAARMPGAPSGHMAVFCNAAPKCRSAWYRPRCERRQRATASAGDVTTRNIAIW